MDTLILDRAATQRQWAAANIRPGTQVRFAQPIRFLDGAGQDTFTVHLADSDQLTAADGTIVTAADWRGRDFLIVCHGL